DNDCPDSGDCLCRGSAFNLSPNLGDQDVFHMPKLKFEKPEVDGLFGNVKRAKIPGGWLLIAMSNTGGGVTFYPDPEYKWNGGSVADDPVKFALVSPRGALTGAMMECLILPIFCSPKRKPSTAAWETCREHRRH